MRPTTSLLFLCTLLLAAPALAAKPGARQADGSRYVAGTLYAAAEDAADAMAWDDAKAWCEASTAHGRAGWRLPDADELALLYKHRKAIGGFADPDSDALDPQYAYRLIRAGGMIRYDYLSATRNGDDAAGLDFETGKPATLAVVHDMPTTFAMRVRCVRNGT